jgi:hypothetical protein
VRPPRISSAARGRCGRLGVLALAIGSALCVGVVPARAAVLWSGNFDTGDFSQWDRLQAEPGDASIVGLPHDGLALAAKFVVNPGDNPINSKGERTEVVASQSQTGGYQGSAAWYGWSTFFPPELNAPTGSWNIFTQWHQTLSDGCPPNIAFQIDNSAIPTKIKFRVRGGTQSGCTPSSDMIWRPATLGLGTWLDFVLHVKWSSNASGGFVELFIDGTKVIPKTYLATLYVGQGCYLKQGFYRAPSSLISTIFDSGMRRGQSYADVAP